MEPPGGCSALWLTVIVGSAGCFGPSWCPIPIEFPNIGEIWGRSISLLTDV